MDAGSDVGRRRMGVARMFYGVLGAFQKIVFKVMVENVDFWTHSLQFLTYESIGAASVFAKAMMSWSSPSKSSISWSLCPVVCSHPNGVAIISIIYIPGK